MSNAQEGSAEEQGKVVARNSTIDAFVAAEHDRRSGKRGEYE